MLGVGDWVLVGMVMVVVALVVGVVPVAGVFIGGVPVGMDSRGILRIS